jgi:hypothetical protein
MEGIRYKSNIYIVRMYCDAVNNVEQIVAESRVTGTNR